MFSGLLINKPRQDHNQPRADRRIFMAALALTATGFVINGVPAVAQSEGAINVAQPAALDINALETRFFSRLYDKDTIDKRLQRLELLLFGATQDGSMIERLARIQEVAAERAHVNKPSNSENSDGGQLNAISALEKKILKKSFASESLSQRLTRLESKVFGLPTPSMSVSDRVSRLKKIIGYDTPTISQYQPLQEMPNSGLVSPFSGGFAYSMPFGPGTRPDEMTQQMNDIFKRLNRELRGIHRLPDGAPNVSPFTGPNGTPFVQPFPNTPSSRDRNTDLPPYLDPNSI